MAALVATSAALIAASGVTLVLGWGASNNGLIWGSIALSALAGIALAAAQLRAGRPSMASPQAPEHEVETAAPESRPGLGTGRRATFRRPSTPASPSTPRLAEAAIKPGVSRGETDVVAIPRRGKYHRTDCRYARSQGTERMTRALATHRGYSPCGTCKP